MTNRELKNILIQYAQEDLALAEQSGSVIICDTKVGVIDIHCIGEVFQAYNKQAEQLTGLMNKKRMSLYLVDLYDTTEVEVED